MSEEAALRCRSFLLVDFMVNEVNLGSKGSRGKKTTSPQPYVLFSSSLCPSWVRRFSHLVQENLNCPHSGNRGREIILLQPRFFFWVHGFLSLPLPQATFLGKMRLAEFFLFLLAWNCWSSSIWLATTPSFPHHDSNGLDILRASFCSATSWREDKDRQTHNMHIYMDIFIEKWMHVNVPVVGLVDGYMLGSGLLLTSLKFGTESEAGNSVLFIQEKQATGPTLCLWGPRLWTDFLQLFKVPSGAWDNSKCQRTMDGVIPGGSLHCSAGSFLFKIEWNWVTRMVLTGRLWVTQIVYRDRDWQKKKKNLPRSQMLKGWPWLEIQIWK